jgi:hypothetical protein
MAEEFDLVCHFLGRLSRYQFEQPAHLLADRVMLLLGKNNPRMERALRQKLRVQAEVISYVKAIKRPFSL